jgi:hypothetical protein
VLADVARLSKKTFDGMEIRADEGC